MRVTQRYPVLVPVRLAQRRLVKRMSDLRQGYRYARDCRDEDLPVLVHEHSSLLVRSLAGVDPALQRNKVRNLGLAAGRIDGVLVAPGETFSFWRLVGSATKRRGYVDGLVLREGAASSGVGGGLCQISNMLHWLALHSDLQVVERHRHSFDPFPDSERVVPFGTGATLLEHIYDLKFTNPTKMTYQVRLRLGPTHLVGQLRAAQEPPDRYEVLERDHRYVRDRGEVLRCNTIVRRTLPAADGRAVETTLFANRCRVGYEVDEDLIVD